MTSPNATFRSAPAVVTTPAGTHRHLRIGIIQGGRIVEERVLRAPRATKSVTIGPASSNTFVTPPDELGRLRRGSWRLFEEGRGRIVLRLPPGASARVAIGSEVTPYEAAASDPGGRAIVLGDGARGKVTLGETTLLFQLVRPPVSQPRPQLPISVRRHVISELDGLFTALLAVSFLLHLSMVVYLRQVDWPRRPSLDEVPDRFVRMARRPKLTSTPTPTPTPAPARPVASVPKAKPAATHVNPATSPAATPRPAPSAAERRAALEQQVHKTGLLAVIGALADGPSATADLLKSGMTDQATEDALKGVTGVTVAQNEGLRNLPRASDGGGRVATPADLRSNARIVEADNLGPATERAARSVVREGPPQIEDGKVDAAAIAREIRARRKAIAACYERALKQQPTLAGKLVVRCSLAAAGTVSAVDIDDDTLGAPDVAACIRGVVLRWRFPALAEGAAELSFPFVFQPGG